MERTSAASDRESAGRDQHRDADGRSRPTDSGRGPVGALHRVAGNQAVQSHASRSETEPRADSEFDERRAGNGATGTAVQRSPVSGGRGAQTDGTDAGPAGRQSAIASGETNRKTPRGSVREVSASTVEAKRQSSDVAVVDVRSPTAFREGHVPGARNVPLSAVSDRIDRYREADEVVAYCQSGRRSQQATQVMRASLGTHTRVSDFAGGMRAWRYPTERGDAASQSGTGHTGRSEAGNCSTCGRERDPTETLVQRLHETGVVQASLTVSQPSDPAEREAERVAEGIMTSPGDDGVTGSVQRRGGPNQGSTVEGETADRIESLQGSGRPLSRSTRSFFESRFGRDFADVRVHTGSNADRTARSIGAEAFTMGTDIAFRTGNYRPNTTDGKRLLAHELTHVVQQTAGGSSGTSTIQRRVDEDRVSCADYPDDHPTIQTIGTTTPVETIRDADSRAIKLLNDAIGRLEHYREQVANDGGAGVDAVSDLVSDALSSHLGIDPTDRSNWTGDGAGTVPVVIERLKAGKQMLDAGNIPYTCIGDPAHCEAKDWVAYTYPPDPRIHLCRSWWNMGEYNQGLTLFHEVMHVYFDEIMDHDHDVDARSYEELVDALSIRIIRAN